jgi:hypothetical protein
MSISPVNTANATTPAAATTSSAASGHTTAARDTVHISSAARTAVQQEASENPAQTLKEAASGDHVAKARLAKHVP